MHSSIRTRPWRKRPADKIYDMVVAEKLQVQGFHYPFPGLGNVEKDGNGYRVIPAPWNPVI